jgi:peptide/nickel transport system substrate-binding protein
MIYDTLFAMDEKLDIKPQMVDTYSVSNDKLTYTFTLRGACSGTTRAGQGGRLCDLDQALGPEGQHGPETHAVHQGVEVVGEKTFQLILKEPYGWCSCPWANPAPMCRS